MRICFITDEYLPEIGGTVNHIYSLAKEFKKLNHNVHIITHRIKNNVILDNEIPVHRLRATQIKKGEFEITFGKELKPQFMEIMKKYEFDIIHGHNILSHMVFSLIYYAHKMGKKTVITKHSCMAQRMKLISKFYSYFCRYFLNKRVDGVIFVSELGAKEFPPLSIPTKIIKNGVDVDKWCFNKKIKYKVRNDLGFDDNDVIVGYLSRFIKRKGILTLIEMAPSIINKFSNVKFLLIGDGPLKDIVVKKVKKMGIESYFRILPSCRYDETPYFFNAFDIFAFPSYGEGFSLAIIEAMACEVPVICKNNWGAKEAIKDGVGLLANDDKEFFNKLCFLIENKELRQEIGKNARAYVIKNFLWQKIATETINFYNLILKK